MRLIKANEVFQTTSDKIGVTPVNNKNTVSLFYCADGVNFDKWNTAIQFNAVITNIPVGLFLKFSDDCIITDK